MGKWAARLAEKTPLRLHSGTVKTDERGVLSVLAVTHRGGTPEIQAPGSDASTSVPASEPTRRPEAPDLAVGAWTDADIARFLDRRARLMRWGWPEADAEKLADRLVQRNREHDERVSCTDCQHYRPGRCGNHRRAGLHGAEVGRDLAEMLQRCPGFVQKEGMQ